MLIPIFDKLLFIFMADTFGIMLICRRLNVINITKIIRTKHNTNEPILNDNLENVITVNLSFCKNYNFLNGNVFILVN